MREDTATSHAWVPPETPSGAPAPVPTSWGTATATGAPDPVAGTAGVAVARGDARFPSAGSTGGAGGPDVAAGPNAPGRPEDLVGNPLAALGVVGPGGILDGGFALLRFRFWRFVGLAAVLFVPIQLVSLWLSLTVGTPLTSDRGTTDVTSIVGPQGLGGSGWGLVVLAVRALALCLLGLATGHQVAGWLEGRDPTFGRSLAFAARRAWVTPVVVVVATAAKLTLSCLGGIGWFLADGLFFIAGVVAGAETLGPFATIGRSVRLTRAAYGVALVTCVGGFVISQILQLALTLGPVVLVASFGPPEGWLVVLQQVASLVLLVALPLTACIAARAYVDLRCRTEGYDLVRRQEDRGLV